MEPGGPPEPEVEADEVGEDGAAPGDAGPGERGVLEEGDGVGGELDGQGVDPGAGRVGGTAHLPEIPNKLAENGAFADGWIGFGRDVLLFLLVVVGTRGAQPIAEVLKGCLHRLDALSD